MATATSNAPPDTGKAALQQQAADNLQKLLAQVLAAQKRQSADAEAAFAQAMDGVQQTAAHSYHVFQAGAPPLPGAPARYVVLRDVTTLNGAPPVYTDPKNASFAGALGWVNQQIIDCVKPDVDHRKRPVTPPASR